jgi:hypothetical protein
MRSRSYQGDDGHGEQKEALTRECAAEHSVFSYERCVTGKIS